MSAPARGGRLRAYLEFIAAVLYFFVVRSFARNAAIAIHHDAWAPLVEQFLVVLLLVLGYAAFGSIFDKQVGSIAAQGLPLRPGWTREVAAGMAVGWGAVVVCVLAMVVIGGIAVVITTQSAAWPWLLVDAVYFAIAHARRRSRFSWIRVSALYRCCRIIWRGIWIRVVLRDRLCAAARGHQRQHRYFRGLQLSAHDCVSAHARALGKLGDELWLESFPGPDIRSHG